jgi:hypothetical protein
MLQYIPARVLAFPVAFVLGAIGYNLERILMPPKRVGENATADESEEKGITQTREERLLKMSHGSNENTDIYTQRHNLFDKNDAKHLK